MPPVVNPVSDLARIYRQRIPTQTGQPAARSDRFGFGMATRPTGQTSSNPLGAVGRFLKTAVASLDPRFILSEGGRSLEHVVGDATELARSVFTGEDTLSQSPSARAYQAAGGGAPGVFAAAMPYANVATALVPEARLLTPAGRVAAGADAAERVGQSLMNQAVANEAQRVKESMLSVPKEMLAQSAYGLERVGIKELADELAKRNYSFQNYPVESSAIWSWSQPNEYKRIQNMLRGTGVDPTYMQRTKQTVDALDRLIATSPRFADPATVFRGISPKTAAWEQIKTAIEAAKPGDIIWTDPGFTATTFDPGVMGRFAADDNSYRLIIRTPSGTRGINVDAFLRGKYPSGEEFSTAVGEQEFLLPRNTALKFVRREGNRIFVDAVPGRIYAAPFKQQANTPIIPSPIAPFNLKEALLEGGPSVA